MQTQLAAVRRYTQEKLRHDQTGHNMDHIERVVGLAEQILATEAQADPLIVLTAAYVHDTVDDKLIADEQQAYKELTDFLQQQQFSAAASAEIVHILHNMSYSKALDGAAEPLSLAGQIVQDADRLDALGAIGILRTSYYGGSTGHPIYDPQLAPAAYGNRQDYRKGSTVINHFYEKLLLLPDQMNTAYGRKEGQRRKVFMEAFLKEFFWEWHGRSDHSLGADH